MTSDVARNLGGFAYARTAFVWIWLPGALDPVVAGRLDAVGDIVQFTYGRSYLERADAIPLYLPELPLVRGPQRPLADLPMPGVIADSAPDAWGRRLVDARYGATADLPELTYLLEGGSDRIGALGFQTSPTEFVDRATPATLDDLTEAAAAFEAGRPLPPGLDAALLHGTSIGGARPKALLDDGGRPRIAKFSSTTDPYPVVKAEAVAMSLAQACGIDVARTEVASALGRDLLLVDRFDRGPGHTRRIIVSALTILGLQAMTGRYATYPDLADAIRARFTEPTRTLRELFTRIVFNVAVGNTDDHARNHAAFWDGERLTLTPAYDLCPQPRSGEQAAQAMAIGRDGARESRFAVCVDAAEVFRLDRSEAQDVVDRVVTVIRERWPDTADRVGLTNVERDALWERQILNPFAFYPG